MTAKRFLALPPRNMAYIVGTTTDVDLLREIHHGLPHGEQWADLRRLVNQRVFEVVSTWPHHERVAISLESLVATALGVPVAAVQHAFRLLVAAQQEDRS